MHASTHILKLRFNSMCEKRVFGRGEMDVVFEVVICARGGR